MAIRPKTLGCAGLSPREATQARLLLDVLQERLQGRWQLVESADSDVVLADPRNPAGQEAVGDPQIRTRVIAVTDRDSRPPSRVGAHLNRPFRSEALIRAINQVIAASDRNAIGERRTAGTDRQPLARTLRAALVAKGSDGVTVVEGLGSTPLVIDGAHDSMRGPFEAINSDLLMRGTSFDTRTLPVAEAAGIAVGAPETDAYAWLWALGKSAGRNTSLFGDPEETRVRLSRWPRLGRLDLARRETRVIGIARQQTATVAALARMSGVLIDELTPLFNAAWLAGDLEIAERAAAPAARRSRAGGPRPAASLLGRIRRRLGTA